MSFFKNLIEEIKDEDTSIASDGAGSAEFGGFIDTGSYVLNAVLSGSLYGGVPDNKITAFAGESATGKTYFVLSIVRAFLNKHPEGGVIYYDTEAAVTRKMMSERGIDTDRVIISEPDTIQKFRMHALKMLDAYEKQPEDKRPPMMMVLDSLGLLSTTKELEDSTEGKETRDMTKAQTIKATFRVLTLKLAKVKVPMLVTNHVYDMVGSYVPTKEMGGGCLVAGTEIHTSKGLQPIESLTIGDEVLTMDGYYPIVDTFRFEDKEVFEIEFDDGNVIKCSGDHKFLVDGSWVSVYDMIRENTAPYVEHILVNT